MTETGPGLFDRIISIIICNEQQGIGETPVPFFTPSCRLPSKLLKI